MKKLSEMESIDALAAEMQEQIEMVLRGEDCKTKDWKYSIAVGSYNKERRSD